MELFVEMNLALSWWHMVAKYFTRFHDYPPLATGVNTNVSMDCNIAYLRHEGGVCLSTLSMIQLGRSLMAII